MPLSKDRNIVVPQEELDRQMEFCGLVHTVLETRLDGRRPLAYVHTFGCQGNVADSERLKGLLEKMGFGFTEEFSALMPRINSRSCFTALCLPASVYLISKIPTALSRKTCLCTETAHSKRGCR